MSLSYTTAGKKPPAPLYSALGVLLLLSFSQAPSSKAAKAKAAPRIPFVLFGLGKKSDASAAETTQKDVPAKDAKGAMAKKADPVAKKASGGFSLRKIYGLGDKKPSAKASISENPIAQTVAPGVSLRSGEASDAKDAMAKKADPVAKKASGGFSLRKIYGLGDKRDGDAPTIATAKAGDAPSKKAPSGESLFGQWGKLRGFGKSKSRKNPVASGPQLEGKSPGNLTRNESAYDPLVARIAQANAFLGQSSQAYKEAKAIKVITCLEEALGSALDYSVDIAQALVAVQQAADKAFLATSAWSPQLGVRAQAPVNRETPYASASYTSYEPSVGVELKQNILAGYGTVSAVRQAKYAYWSAVFQYQGTLQTVFMNVIELYADCIESQELLNIAVENEKYAKEISQQAEIQYEAGQLKYSEKVTANSRAIDARAEVNGARIRLAERVALLQQITGNPLAPHLKDAGPWKSMPKENLAACMAVAFKKNPNLLGTIYNQRAAKEELGVQQAAFYPTVDLGLSATLSRKKPYVQEENAWQDPSYTYGSTGASLSVGFNIPVNGVPQAQCRLAKLGIFNARLETEKARRSLLQECEKFMVQCQQTEKILDEVSKALPDGKRALDAAQQERILGLIDIADVFNAQELYVRLRQRYANAYYTLVKATYHIAQVMGSLEPQAFGIAVQAPAYAHYKKNGMRNPWGFFGTDPFKENDQMRSGALASGSKEDFFDTSKTSAPSPILAAPAFDALR